MPKATLRCDASPELGFGHVFRCLVLARELRSRGVEVVFAARGHEHVSGIVGREGFDTLVIPRDGSDSSEANQLGETGDLVVVDLLAPSESYQQALRRTGTPALIIDGSRLTPCHGRWLLDPRPIPDPEHFERRLRERPETEYLGGPPYALYEGGEVPASAPRENRLLISMGGGDDRGAIRSVIENLEGWKRPLELVVQTRSHNPGLAAIQEAAAHSTRHAVEVVLDTPLINEVAGLSWCAIVAGGVSCYEMLSMGVPLILIPISDNQEPAARAWHELEVAHNLGPYPLEDGNRLLDALRDLSRPGRREERSRRGRRLCDGRGAERVAARILAELGG
jgi:spore coat polysaccharide biosynthesis predicted glycosyltransferase SpsG